MGLKQKLVSALLAFTVATTMLVGVLALAETAQVEAACRCPLVFKPVTCSNGQTYANACYARCDGAKGGHSAGP